MADDLTEDENQLLWKYATDDVTTEELSQIEQLATTNAAFARHLSEMEAQKKSEAARHEKASKRKSTWPFWAFVVLVIGLIVWWIAS